MADDPGVPGRIRAVHQFHSGSALGDAVTNSLLFTQRFLKELPLLKLGREPPAYKSPRP